MTKAIDEIDRGIISTLEHDGRASLAEIGKVVGLSGPAVGERLRRLQSDGWSKDLQCVLTPKPSATRWRPLSV